MTDKHQHSNIENKIFFSKYKPDKKIGEGSFGKIYSAHSISSGEKYAIKLELRSCSQQILEQESYILSYLKGEGIPFIKSFGYSGNYNLLVMELLGKSLEELFQDRGCKFSVKTVCMLGEQMITRMQFIHGKHILHRDIKPDNFTIGVGENAKKVYLIDFGLSKKYRSSRTLQHIRYCENKKLTGTARYASIHALKGCEQGRRDDMEAIGYVFMYFLRGSLPWQGLKVKKNEDRYKRIYEKKKMTTAAELCTGFPKEFCEYVEYTRAMAFEQEPDYDYLRKLLRNVMNDKGYSFDYIYDWCTPSSQESQTSVSSHHNSNQWNQGGGQNHHHNMLASYNDIAEKTRMMVKNNNLLNNSSSANVNNSMVAKRDSTNDLRIHNHQQTDINVDHEVNNIQDGVPTESLDKEDNHQNTYSDNITNNHTSGKSNSQEKNNEQGENKGKDGQAEGQQGKEGDCILI